MAVIQPFPESFIALNQEICNHPELQKRIQKHHDADAELQFSKCIAEICTYCNVVIDGHFTESQFIEIADKLVWRLRDMRAEKIGTVVGTPLLIDVNGQPLIKH